MSSVTFEFTFSDITLLEADGVYSEVKELMSDDASPSIKKDHPQKIQPWSPKSESWMLISEITIESMFGIGHMSVHAHSDRRMVIHDYIPSVGDVYYNPDMQAFSEWCQQNGWRPPEPSTALAKGNIDFWRHYWQTLLVDSPYLDSVYGKRPQLEGLDEE
jgi:hypothetical protein